LRCAPSKLLPARQAEIASENNSDALLKLLSGKTKMAREKLFCFLSRLNYVRSKGYAARVCDLRLFLSVQPIDYSRDSDVRPVADALRVSRELRGRRLNARPYIS
jgi:hypothetical protein